MPDRSLALAARWPGTVASLRYPNYRRWSVGQALSLMGTWMQSVAQGWVVYELTGSQLALGTITFVGTIPSFFLMLPVGTAPLGSLMAGAIGQAFNPTVSVVTGALITLAFALFIFFAVPSLRRIGE